MTCSKQSNCSALPMSETEATVINRMFRLSFACAIINRLDLLHHHKSDDFRMIMHSHMERKSPIFSGERANDSKTRMLSKLSIAHDQHRSPAHFSLILFREKVYKITCAKTVPADSGESFEFFALFTADCPLPTARFCSCSPGIRPGSDHGGARFPIARQ
jgi:hypothetical protein